MDQAATTAVEEMRGAVSSMERTRETRGMPFLCCRMFLITLLAGRPPEHARGCSARKAVRP
jgi:hypothetical protein